MRLRPLRAEDRPALGALLADTRAFTDAEIAVALELVDLGLESAENGYRFVVAEAHGGVSGYACFGATPLTIGVWDLYWLAVATAEQARGIGSELLAAAESEAGTAGGRMVVVETASKPSYEQARRFYARKGYHEVARVPDFYAEGDDKVIYVKQLRTGRETAPRRGGAGTVPGVPGRQC